MLDMDLSPESGSHTSPHAHDAVGSHHISCTNCRKRKIKCNRIEPCGPCTRAGVECVFRARAPRSQNKGKDPKSREAELLLRLSRLEGLVSKIDPAAIREARGKSDELLDPPFVSLGFEDESPEPAGVHSNRSSFVDPEEQFSDFVKAQEHWTRHVNSDFWNNLSGEIQGLRQLLEEPTNDREDEYHVTPITPPKHAPPYFLFSESSPYNLEDEIPYPNDEHREILHDFFFANVDPVCKIINRYTAEKFLNNAQELMDDSGRRYKFVALEAVTFAMYFTAVGSVSPEKCLQYFGEDRDVLLRRYRLGAEVALLKGDFLNSMNIIFLLAFVVYIIGLRASRNSQSCWVYIGLATRMAYSLGIHRDGDGLSLSAHEAEVRRRTWWQIYILDMKASEDRGCEPMLCESNFNIRVPLNIEDEDFTKHTLHPIQERKGITKMTYSLIGIQVAQAIQKLHFIPLSKSNRVLSLEEKEKMAKDCISKVDKYFSYGYDPTNQLHLVTYMMSRILTLKLWLVVQYPMQQIYTANAIQPRSRCLRHVVELLTIADTIGTNEYASRFNWHFETSVSWHPLAVALAELCTQTEGPLADEAWRVIDKHWQVWSVRIASSQEEKMWRPVRRLLKRAREAREGKKRPTVPPEVQKPTPKAKQVKTELVTPVSYQAESLQSLSIGEANDTPDINLPDSQDPPSTYSQSRYPPDQFIDARHQGLPHEPSELEEMANVNITTNPIGPGNLNGHGVSDPYSSWNGYVNTPVYTGTEGMPVGENITWDDWNAFIFDAGAVDPSLVHDKDSWESPPDFYGGGMEGII